MTARVESGFPVASFKALDEATGEFEALFSVFGNVDLGGDRVVKGAFEKTLAKWRESGDPIPVYWNHMWDDPFANIGGIAPEDAKEIDEGLFGRGKVDMDNPLAAQVYRLLKERRVKEFSFGYTVQDSVKADDGALDLLDLDLIEVGPTLKGMNPETQLLAVKAYDQTVGQTKAWADACAELKAGARLSKSTRSTLEQARDLLSDLLSEDDQSPDETKSIEAEAAGNASALDEVLTQLNLRKGMNTGPRPPRSTSRLRSTAFSRRLPRSPTVPRTPTATSPPTSTPR
jgi:HK97 family phage prohead protease